MTTKKKRKFHSPEFKAEALKLAAKTSVPSAAKELGLQESQLYSWRAAANRKNSVSERESRFGYGKCKTQASIGRTDRGAGNSKKIPKGHYRAAT